MKTFLIVEIDHSHGTGQDFERATRALVDSYLYRHGVVSVTVKDATPWLPEATQLQLRMAQLAQRTQS